MTIDWSIVLTVVGVFVVIAANFGLLSPHTHFAWLAESFLHGRLDIAAIHVMESGFIDIAEYGGRFYWPLPIGPALVLMPFVLVIDPSVAQAVVQVLVTFGIAYLAYVTAIRLGTPKEGARWLAVAFVMASVVIGVVTRNTPWTFGNALSALFLLLAVHEHVGEDRPWRTGVFASAAFLMRFTAGVGAVYLGVAELLAPRPMKERARRILILALPLVVAIVLTGAYNHARFGDPLETGHTYHHIIPTDVRAEFTEGMFAVSNIEKNAFVYFLSMPDMIDGLPVVSPYGVSVFVLSPIFLWLVFARLRDRRTIAALIATMVALAVFLPYFTTGYWQFGPRYLLDVLPFWYPVLVLVFIEQGLRRRHRALIAGSAIVNLALLVIFLSHHLTLASAISAAGAI